ncbi:AAA family ATPase [Roseivirga seohaensis]|uniref:AAA family ATPase n=1 Tax=Roseivirga seohaensis TaxID=1914963 RepID=UPI003BABC10D
MSKKDHLVNFRVENFKRFKELSLENLGQFNLIVGDNNVGKTSALEALLYDVDRDRFSSNLLSALSFKNLGGKYVEGHFSFFINKNVLLQSKDREIVMSFKMNTIEASNLGSKVYSFTDQFIYDRYGNLAEWGIDYFSSNSEPSRGSTLPKRLDNDANTPVFECPFIPFSLSYGKELTDLFSIYFVRDSFAREQLLKSLTALIPDIKNMSIDTHVSSFPVILVEQNDMRSAIPLVSFGDGVLKLFRILLYIILFRGQRLMIDEIDTGIHYSRMKDFWRTILKAAEENEVQLFVTTHNQECIRYFKEALEERGMEHLQKEARTITLVENYKTKAVKAITSSFEELEHAVEYGNEIR